MSIDKGSVRCWMDEFEIFLGVYIFFVFDIYFFFCLFYCEGVWMVRLEKFILFQ